MAATDTNAIRERIAAFSKIPDDALIDPRTFAGLLACSVATVKRRVRDGLIPRPIVLNVNVHRWRAGTIRKVLRQLAREAQQ